MGGSGAQDADIVYNTPITNTDLKVPVMGITDLGYQINNGKIDFELKVIGKSTTYFRFRAQFDKNSYLRWLKITYMAIDNSFAPAVSLNFYFPVRPFLYSNLIELDHTILHTPSISQLQLESFWIPAIKMFCCPSPTKWTFKQTAVKTSSISTLVSPSKMAVSIKSHLPPTVR